MKVADVRELMRLRYWAALLVVGGIAFGVSAQWDRPPSKEVALSDSAPAGLQSGNGSTGAPSGNDGLGTGPAAARDDMPPQADNAVTWTRVVGAGDSLSGLLAEAGLDTEASSDVTGAIGSEYDLRHLKPGYRLDVTISSDGQPRTATLEIEDGARILATFGAAPSVQKLAPDLDSVRRASE